MQKREGSLKASVLVEMPHRCDLDEQRSMHCFLFCRKDIPMCHFTFPVLNQRPRQWITIGENVRYAGISVDIDRGETHIISMS